MGSSSYSRLDSSLLTHAYPSPSLVHELASGLSDEPRMATGVTYFITCNPLIPEVACSVVVIFSMVRWVNIL